MLTSIKSSNNKYSILLNRVIIRLLNIITRLALTILRCNKEDNLREMYHEYRILVRKYYFNK